MTKNLGPAIFKIERKEGGDQIIQLFCRFGSTKEMILRSLIAGNLKKLRKALLKHVECIEIY